MRSLSAGAPALYRPAMDVEAAVPEEIASRFRSELVLKRLTSSAPSSAAVSSPEKGEVAAVLRRIDVAPWWGPFPLARHLFSREARALAIAGRLGIPRRRSCSPDAAAWSGGWIDGLPLDIAEPTADPAYFQSAKRALRALHCALLTHNDLAKGQKPAENPGRARRADRFSACLALSPPYRLFRVDGVRRPASSAQAQAPLRAGEPDRRRTARARAQEAGPPGSGWRRASASTIGSRGAC